MAAFRIFLGGPSQSGKTTTAARLACKLGFVHICLDKDPALRTVMHGPPIENKHAHLRRRVFEIVDHARRDSIIEGSQVTPEEITAHLDGDPTALCAFCGYPHANLVERLRSLRDAGFPNAAHLRRRSHPERLARLRKYRDTGRRVEKMCKDLGLIFGDFSDLDTRDADQEDFMTRIAEQVARQRASG